MTDKPIDPISQEIEKTNPAIEEDVTIHTQDKEQGENAQSSKDIIDVSIPLTIHQEEDQDTVQTENVEESSIRQAIDLSVEAGVVEEISTKKPYIESDIHVSLPHIGSEMSETKIPETVPEQEPVQIKGPSLQERDTQLEKGNKSFSHIKEKFPNLGRPLVLDEGKFPKGSQISIWTITFMVGAFIAWAAVTPIKEVAVSQGQIIPSSFVKTIQHLEGGIVKEILIEDGSEVKKGDVLLRLESATALSDLEQIRVKEMGLRIKAERLRAFGMEETPNFKPFERFLPNLVKDQQDIYDMQDKNRSDQREVIYKQMEQRKATLAVQEGRVQDLEHQVAMLEKQRDVIKGLYQKRLKTGTEYRSTEDRLAEILVELNQARNSVLESLQGIREIESRMLELTTRLRNEALMEMGNVTAEIAQVEEAKTNLHDRVKRLEVTAPASGIVKGLKHTTLNGVIQPAGEILQIVPKENMEVEAKVQPKDVGKLRAGQNVLVKVTAFDYARYGGIKGTVKSVSATTFTDEKNNPFYRVFISLHKQYLGGDSKKKILTPGMMVQADIETDEKTLLQYLIKPIYVALHDSFHER